MSMTTLGEYQFASRDALENYAGRQLLYINWEQHRMFSRPFVVALAPQTCFTDIVAQHIAPCYCYHPDFAHIDWNTVTWRNGSVPFQPDWKASLAENGIGHKDLIRFTTPGLNGIAGTGY
jgi:phenol hydroxylase P4 protein